jgi:hypothetical protein
MILAYLDPGSGSLILQAVLGGAAGIGVAAKAMRRRWQTRNLTDEASPDEASPDETSADTEPEHQSS